MAEELLTPQAEQQAQTEAHTMDQQLQTQEIPPLPEERIAGLSANIAKYVLKTAKPADKPKKVSEILLKYGIEEVKAPKVKKPSKLAKDTATNVIVDEAKPIGSTAGKVEDDVIQVPKNFSAEKEAAGLRSNNLEDIDTTQSHHINFDTMETEDDVKAVVAQMAENNAGQITEARRGIVTDEQLRGLADDLGADTEFIQQVLTRESGELMSGEHILASRQVMENSAVRLKQLADRIAAGNGSDKDKFLFSKQHVFHQQFMNQFMGMRAEYGRGLRAFGVPTGSGDVQTARMTEVLTMVGNKLDVNQLAKQIATMDSSKGINLAVQAQQSMSKMAFDSAFEVYIAGILSGVKTHIVNTSGSMLRLGMDSIDLKVASLMPAGDVTKAEKIAGDEWKAALYGQMGAFRDALHTASQVMKTGEAYGGIDKIDTLNLGVISASNYGMKEGTFAAGAVDLFGSVIRAPLERVMGSTDSFFKVISERSRMASVAYREVAAIAEREGMNQEQALKLLNDMIENPSEDIRRQAGDFALDVTFQTPLGKTGQDIQRIIAKTPLRYVMPFVKTPTNLLKQGFLERTPAGILTAKYKADVAAGGARAQMARSKMLTGSGMAITAWQMAESGFITGSNPKDAATRKARHEAGWRPRSIPVPMPDGTKLYVSYDRMEPFSYIFGSVADMYEMSEERKFDKLTDEDSDKFERMSNALVVGIAENTLNKSFMTGIREIMNVWTDPKRYGESYLKNTINSRLPYAGLRRDVSRLIDEERKTTDSIFEYVQANIPGLSEGLPTRLDNYGDEVKYDTVLSPWPTVAETDDFVKLEVKRLADSTRMPVIPSGDNKISGIEMTNQEYHDFKKLSRKDLEVGGSTFKETIEEFMLSSTYEKMIDDDKVLMIRNITQKFDQAAEATMSEENEGLMDRIIKRKMIRAAKYKAKTEGIPEAEAQAELFQGIGE